ncbi:response regulator [gamma proteobacterium NOR5-3]|nr:response regulator [gamma proteobacterium NOR5-3]
MGLSANSQALNPDRLLSQYLLDHYGRDSGLPSDRVWVSTEGPRGYLWIGTQGGLARFDGVNFKAYNQQSHPAFKASDIRALEWTPDGDLWIGTYGGGAVRMRGKEFTTFTTDDGLIGNVIYDIHRTVDGSIWFATDQGVSQLVADEFSSWTVDDGLAFNGATHIAQDQQGTLWFSSLTNGVSFFDGGRFEHIGLDEGLDSLQIHMLKWDKELGIIVGTATGSIYQLSAVQGPQKLPMSNPVAIEEYLRDRDGNRWLGSYGEGLWRASADGSETRFSFGTGNETEHIFSLIEDTRGTLWASTTRGLFGLRDSPFLSLGTAEGLADSTFVVTADNDGTVWAGSEPHGLFRISADGKLSQPHPELINKTISSLLISVDGSLWIGTFGEGLFRIHNGVITHFGEEDGLFGLHIFALQQLRDGTIWISTNLALNIWQDDASPISQPLPELDGKVPRHILEGKDGTVWLSSAQGLFIYRNGLLEQKIIGDGPTSSVVRASYEDERGVLWIAAGNGTLSRLDQGRLFTFDSSHGLPFSAGYAILEDKARNLWISGTQGLLRVSRDSLDAVARGERNVLDTRLFDETDGLRSTQFVGGFQPAAWSTPDNRLWFVSTKGLMAFSPQGLASETPMLRTYIDAVRVDGSPIDLLEPLQLPADFQSLEIDYSSPELSNPQSVNFRYSIAANSDSWTSAGDRRTAYFTALPAGNTVFRVQASFNGESPSQSSENVAALSINRAPHWYETTWSVLVAAALIGLLVTLLQRFQSRNARRKEQQLRALVDLRTRELREALVRVEANSRIDSLTGVANRRHLEEQLNATWSMARRSGAPVSILMLDIDLFKQYNDTLGHSAGDDCLRLIAQAIKSKLLREHDMLARYGGEEFVVLLYDTDAKGAERAANRILDCVRVLDLPHPASDVSEHVTISIGCATLGEKERDDPHRLIDLADKALYQAKAQGRNRACSSNQESTDTPLERR